MAAQDEASVPFTGATTQYTLQADNSCASATNFGLGCHATGVPDWDVTFADCTSYCHTNATTAQVNPTSGLHGVIPSVSGQRHDASPPFHPNEQWNYVVKRTLRVKIGDQPEQLCGPGTLIYIPANIVHATIATQDEDVVFFAVKDMSHGIIGMSADCATGAHYDPGFEEKKQP